MAGISQPSPMALLGRASLVLEFRIVAFLPLWRIVLPQESGEWALYVAGAPEGSRGLWPWGPEAELPDVPLFGAQCTGTGPSQARVGKQGSGCTPERIPFPKKVIGGTCQCNLCICLIGTTRFDWGAESFGIASSQNLSQFDSLQFGGSCSVSNKLDKTPDTELSFCEKWNQMEWMWRKNMAPTVNCATAASAHHQQH